MARSFISRIFFFLFAIAISCSSAKTSPETSPPPLVEIARVDPTIVIDLRYATPQNIVGHALYPPEFQARLRPAVALELKNAQDQLRRFGFGLKIWDAYRPIAAQEALFAALSDPRFVSKPGPNAMHNRGVAVDVTLVDLAGKELPMPSQFDEMGARASHFYKGNDAEIAHRLKLLQTIMSRSGFYACRTEWWHFFSRRWEEFPNIDLPSPAGIGKNEARP